MKRLTLLAASLISCLCSLAQTDSIVVWNKWCAKKDSMVLFVAANNLVCVYSPGIKANALKFKSLDYNSLRIGTPEIKGDTACIMAMPYPEKGKTMRLAILDKKTGQTLKVVNFDAASVPPIKASFGHILTSEATKKDLLAQVSMRIFFPNSLYNYPYTLRQFMFKTKHSGGSATMTINGFMLPKELMQQINEAPSGAVLEFSGIKVTCPECAMRTLDDFKIKIK